MRLLRAILESKKDLQFEDVRELVAGPRQREAWLEGNKERGVITTGMVVGLIDDIPSCSELVERIVGEAAKIVERGLPGKLAG